jgi:hypothetical protein
MIRQKFGGVLGLLFDRYFFLNLPIPGPDSPLSKQALWDELKSRGAHPVDVSDALAQAERDWLRSSS